MVDETSERCEKLMSKVDRTELTLAGQKDMYATMEVHTFNGSELQEEDWEDVDEVRMEHFARDCRWRGKGKVKGGGEGIRQKQRMENDVRQGGYSGEQKG